MGEVGTERQKYLLYTAEQIEQYKARFSGFIAKYRTVYRDWYETLPLFRWVQLRIDEKMAEAVIGLLCLLYIDGEIDLTFDNSVTWVYRGTRTESEFNEWAQKLQAEQEKNKLSKRRK